MSRRVSRAEAWDLLTEWVESASLRRHCLAVSASMKAYAEQRGLPAEEVELWEVTGLLHDMDYEKHPDMDDAEAGHPRTAMKVLSERDAPPEMVRAIASHADYLGVSRDSDLEKTLAAVDELSGFVVAVAAIRPTGVHGLTPKSVKKKLKTPAFAAAVSREEITANASALGVDFDEHLRTVIAAIEARADDLDLNGSEAA